MLKKTLSIHQNLNNFEGTLKHVPMLLTSKGLTISDLIVSLSSPVGSEMGI